jgi:hypothetical protein
VPGAGHSITWTHAEVVGEAVVEFLKSGEEKVPVGRFGWR